MLKTSVLDEPLTVPVDCIAVRQPIGTFYLASIDSKILCEITIADVRRLAGEREVESYLGVQRPLSLRRVEELRTFVKTVDACFPSGVIVAVDERCVEFNESRSKLILKTYFDPKDPERSIRRHEIAKVLDGQHRIEGLKGYSGEPFEMNVSIFVGMDIESQAYVFSTVNLAQTKVNKSLAYDLLDYAKSRSPQKTCHNIAVALDSYKGGHSSRKSSAWVLPHLVALPRRSRKPLLLNL